jgi:hypothetical protein
MVMHYIAFVLLSIAISLVLQLFHQKVDNEPYIAPYFYGLLSTLS